MKVVEKKKIRVGKVKKDKSGEDWIIPVYVDGKFNDDMTYYAGNDKEAKKDAEGTRDKIIKDMKNSKEYDLEEKVLKEESTIILEKEFVIVDQGSKKIILEKGDKIKVLQTLLESQTIDLTQEDLDEFTFQVNKIGKFINNLKIIESPSVRGYQEIVGDFDLNYTKNNGILSAFFDRLSPQIYEEQNKTGQLILDFSLSAHVRGTSHEFARFNILKGLFDLSNRTWKF